MSAPASSVSQTPSSDGFEMIEKIHDVCNGAKTDQVLYVLVWCLAEVVVFIEQGEPDEKLIAKVEDMLDFACTMKRNTASNVTIN